MHHQLREIQLLAISIAIALTACARQAADPTPAHSTATEVAPGQVLALSCTSPQHQCISCSGVPFCGIRCPECAPLAQPAPAQQLAALQCRPPQRECIACNGTRFCGLQCPECPAPLAPSQRRPTIALTCTPPLRQCVGCNGAVFCGRQCPECAPQLAPRPAQTAALALTPAPDPGCSQAPAC